MDVGGSNGVQKGLKHCQNAFKKSYKVKKMIKWQCFLKAHKALITKIDVKKMKIGFWVEQCLHALFECQIYVNEITKNHTKAGSGEFCVIFCSCEN